MAASSNWTIAAATHTFDKSEQERETLVVRRITGPSNAAGTTSMAGGKWLYHCRAGSLEKFVLVLIFDSLLNKQISPPRGDEPVYSV
ncbi:hypothetical protein [Thiolapillus sp.]|uniref:hypothetical protein n=1 Tax=Thiolapillus sp. TaxID=2017437 RepID=UPI003AF93552